MSTSIQQVLILDDLDYCRDWLQQSVRHAFGAIEIQTADSVRSALHAIEHTTFDLALIDLGLPDGSGMQVIEALVRGQSKAMAVVSTMFDDDAHLFPALQAGASGYLLKDHSVAQIAELLRGIESGQPPLSPSIARRLLRHFSGMPSPGSNDDAVQANARPQPSALSNDAAAERLSPRETEVLQLIAKGFNVPKVAELLNLSKNTVAGYLKDIYRKLAVSSRAEAALEATRRGLVRA